MRAVFFVHNRDFFGAKLIHLPALYALKNHPQISNVTALTPYQNNRLFLDLGVADNVYAYQKGIRSPVSIVRELKPDVVFSTRPESTPINVAMNFSGAKEKYSFRAGLSGCLYTQEFPNDLQIYRAVNFLNLLGPYKQNASTVDFFANKWGYRRSVEPKQIVVMPGGSNDYKRWGIQKFLDLCDKIGVGYRYLFVLGEQEKEYQAEIEKKGHAFLMNASPQAIVSELAKTKCVIANDCGPAHLAQMVRCPAVLVMSNYDQLGPARAAEWFYQHAESRLMMSDSGEALQNVSPERVFEKVRELI